MYLIYKNSFYLLLFISVHICLYSDQLRQRLVRMSVRHHEQLYAYQQREFQLAQSLRECTQMLEDSVVIIRSIAAKSGYSHPDEVIPPHILDASIKFSVMAQSLSQDIFMDMQGGGSDV